jgi:hypothetical protein
MNSTQNLRSTRPVLRLNLDNNKYKQGGNDKYNKSSNYSYNSYNSNNNEKPKYQKEYNNSSSEQFPKRPVFFNSNFK